MDADDCVVVKVGGSLFAMPDLGVRLQSCLSSMSSGRSKSRVILVPGGGPTTDAIRALDSVLGLGEEASHWLALQALTINAHILAALLPCARLSNKPTDDALTLLDCYAFARADEGQPGCLPHTWEVTSDSVAARVAVVLNARELILLKSAEPVEPIDWHDASRQGYVDQYFPRVLEQAHGRLRVRAVNLRAWQPEPPREIAPDGGRDRR